MSEWLLHFEERTRARVVRFIEEAHRAVSDDFHILGRSLCGFEAVALRAVGARGELEEVAVTVDCDRCMMTARTSEAPLPDTMILNGPLIGRTPLPTGERENVLYSLEHWHDRMSDRNTIGSSDETARMRQDLSLLVRAVVHRLDAAWSHAIVRSRGMGRHHIQLRCAGGERGQVDLEFVSGTSRPGVGGISGQLIEAIDGIIGDHTHVSIWNAGCPADRLPVTIGSTPFIDVGDPEDHMATMRGYAALPDGAFLIPSSTTKT